MAMNKVQFQSVLPLSAFLADYDSERQCKRALETTRWQGGFIYPHRQRHGKLHRDDQWRHQYSLRSTTLLEHNRSPLRASLLAMYLPSQSKTNVRRDGLSASKCWKPSMRTRRRSKVMARAARCGEFPRSANVVLFYQRSLADAYYAVEFTKYAHRYLVETQYRFNRRFDLTTLVRDYRRPRPQSSHGLNAPCTMSQSLGLKKHANQVR
jgi:hypothetical protein